MKTLSFLVDTALSIEKLRVASQVRKAHLERNKRVDKDTDDVIKRLVSLEEWVDGRVGKLITTHPAYGWFSRVKGVGKENIGKVVGSIRVMPDVENPEKPYANTISALWKFAGYAVTDGHGDKRVKGAGKLCYNSQLRTMCFRLGTSLMRAKGKFYDYYCQEKEKYVNRFVSEGKVVVPALELPKENGKRSEGDKYVSEGHVHLMALRKMIKLFLACLWLAWREAEGLPVTQPYALDKLHHDSLISPEQMVDRVAVTKK